MCTSGEEVFYLVVGVFCHFKPRLPTYTGLPTKDGLQRRLYGKILSVS